MIRNYFKIAWRNIFKNKGLFSINIIGLSIGIATCLIITLFVIDEFSYDQYNEKADQIVRVTLKAKLGDELINEPKVMAPVASALVSEFPEVLDATRLYVLGGLSKVTYKENTLRKGKMVFVDPNFFNIFTLPLIQGDAKTALNQPNSVIITKEQAQVYFGIENPLNKSIKIEGRGLYTVTGIIDKVPENSHFNFDLFASMEGHKDAKNQNWMSGSYATYLLMKEGSDVAQLESKLPSIVEKYMGPQLKSGFGMSFEKFLETGNRVGLFLQPLTDIHLYSEFADIGGFEQQGDIKIVSIFVAIALFMLLIACINFMNLSTASASKRIKEIGIRKVLGSRKGQLIIQFLTESFIATLIATGIGIALFALALPYFNQISGKSLTFNQILSQQTLLGLACFTIIVSFFAGGYPAFFMSSFKPIQSLKNRFSTGNSKTIRSSLVVFQFVVSVSLIIGTIIVRQQMDFIQNKDIGYNREHLIVIRDAGLLGDNLIAFKEELQRDAGVQNITTSAFIPAGPTDNNMQTIYTEFNSEMKLRIHVYDVDEEYISTLGMKLIQGRDFSKEYGSENDNIIINESAIKTFGLKSNPIGQKLKKITDNDGGVKDLTIIGVIKDFHSRSLHQPIQPLMLQYNPYYGLIVKAKTADVSGFLANMEKSWTSFGTGETFDYSFLDELYNETYLKEQNLNHILSIFSFLTILVACLGLFGLITFTAEQRFKEIGIRKVLGSTVPQIVGMLSKDFIKLVIISFIIAFPLGFYLMNHWLQDFAYRIDIHWSVFIIAGLLTVFIAFITISLRSIKAARANPIEALRLE